MPSLICDFSNALGQLAGECILLRQAGEPLMVCCRMTAAAPFVVVNNAAEMEAALEDELVPVLTPTTAPPAWLPFSELTRVLLVSATADGDGGMRSWLGWPGRNRLTAVEAEWLQTLFDGGCEAVELLRVQDAVDLSQSWHSGRRVGVRLLAG